MAKLIGYLILTTLFSGLFYLTYLSSNSVILTIFGWSIALVYVGCLTLGVYLIHK